MAHSNKILSQAGISLADVYDIEGSVAGLEELDVSEVKGVHELGGTIFSERLQGAIDRRTTGAIAQNTDWDIILTALGNIPTRILGVLVFTDDSARIGHATVSVRNPTEGRELPIFVWDSAEGVITIRMEDDGAGVANHVALANGGSLNITKLPSMLIGTELPVTVDEMAFRGRTSAFGAGTVTITALIYRAFTQIGGISSYGLPVPSW